MRKNTSFMLFMIGLGSMTQFHFIGSLGISELPIYVIAPFVFLLNYRCLKQDGFLPFIYLTLATCLGCIISSLINSTPVSFAIKGFAHPYSLFALIVVLHRLLRNNLNGLKWILIGICLSNIVNIFIFQPEVTIASGGVVAEGRAALEQSLNDVLLIGSRAKAILCLPVSINYLSMPTSVSTVAVILAGIVFALFSQSSGRSAAAALLMSAALIMIGRKSRISIRAIGRHIVLSCLCLAVAAFSLKAIYSKAAQGGLLGEGALQKYRQQTRAGDGFLQILMAGRMEFFCGVSACLDQPIFGFGPKAEDKNGYVESFMKKYGAADDYLKYLESLRNARRAGRFVYRNIPTHSYIAMFWVYYGIAGLFLWLYVLWLFFMYLKKYAYVVPQWYGYMAVTIPFATWNIFFSPFAGRPEKALYITCLLLVKAIYDKKMSLPIEIEMEAARYG